MKITAKRPSRKVLLCHDHDGYYKVYVVSSVPIGTVHRNGQVWHAPDGTKFPNNTEATKYIARQWGETSNVDIEIENIPVASEGPVLASEPLVTEETPKIVKKRRRRSGSNPVNMEELTSKLAEHFGIKLTGARDNETKQSKSV